MIRLRRKEGLFECLLFVSFILSGIQSTGGQSASSCDYDSKCLGTCSGLYDQGVVTDTCTCASGFTGLNCETKLLSGSCEFLSANLRGECINDGSDHYITCDNPLAGMECRDVENVAANTSPVDDGSNPMSNTVDGDPSTCDDVTNHLDVDLGSPHVISSIVVEGGFIEDLVNCPCRTLRLNGTAEHHIGVVELYFDDAWSRLCYTNVADEANVLCKQFGYTSGGTGVSETLPAVTLDEVTSSDFSSCVATSTVIEECASLADPATPCTAHFTLTCDDTHTPCDCMQYLTLEFDEETVDYTWTYSGSKLTLFFTDQLASTVRLDLPDDTYNICETEIYGYSAYNLAPATYTNTSEDTTPLYPGLCTDISTTTDPWVEVDLGSQHAIRYITFTNTDTPTNTDIKIFVGDEPNESTTQSAEITIVGPTDYVVVLDPSVVGRYVRLAIDGSIEFDICRLEIFGHPYPEFENVAVDGTAEMSSVLNEGSVLDGDNTTCVESYSEEKPWLLLDLELEQTLYAITINSLNLQDLVVSVGTSMANLSTVEYLAGTVDNNAVIRLSPPMDGRYVMLQINDTGNSQLNICEVDVYSNTRLRCNGVAYDENTELCCNGMVQPLFGALAEQGDPSRTQCCDTTSYDTGCYECILDTVQPKFDSTSELCCDGTIRNMAHERSCCCGDALIDADVDICCEGSPRPRTPSDPYCCQCTMSESDKLVDLTVIVKTSENMLMQEYQQVQDFMNDLVLDLSIDNGDVHLAYGMFDTTASLVFNLDDFQTTSAMLTAIAQATRTTGGTEIGAALEMVKNDVCDSTGDRSGVNDVVILVVDQKSNDIIRSLVAADVLHNHDHRIITIAVGPDVDDYEIEHITSEPHSDNLYHISSYDGLASLRNSLVESLFTQCTELPTPSCNGLPYDLSTHVCCEDVEQPKLGNNTQCCRNVSYDASCSVCQIDGSIQLTYNPTSEICCQGNVSVISAAYTCCCDGVAYDASSQTCLVDQIVPRPLWDTSNCCHYRNRNVDVAILVDTSYSVQDADIRALVKLMIAHTISGETQFALTYFKDDVNDVFALGELTEAEMSTAIDNTIINHGGSFAGVALSHVNENVFSTANGDRPDAQDIVVLVTDGYVNDVDSLLQKANEMKTGGVHIIAIALGDTINTTLLEQVVSSPVSENMFSALTIVELAAMNTIIGEQLADPCEVFPVNLYCAGVPYDPSQYSCCGGYYLEPIVTPGATECCGHNINANYQLYNPATAECCFAHIVPIPPSFTGTPTCCSYDSLYDPTSEICCNYVVQPLYGISTTSCCFNTSFDNRCSSCNFNREIVPGFNTETHVCCDGVLSPKTNGLTCCCGTSVFDPTNHVCNAGQYMLRDGSDPSFCCHSRERRFDVAILVGVSSNIAIPTLEFIEAVVNGSDVASNNVQFALTSLGAVPTNIFDLDSNFANSPWMLTAISTITFITNVSDAAAALDDLRMNVFTTADRPDAENIAIIITDTISSNTSQTVLQANLAKQNNIRLVTIGIGPGASSEMLLVASEPTNENAFSVIDASGLSTVIDDILDEFIGECKVYPESVLCGSTPYNPATQVCCDDEVVSIEDQTKTECCGTTLYSSVTSQCCGGSVISNTLQCCGSEGYINGGCERCVDGVLTTDYDQTTHMCCQGVLRAKYFSQSCCCGTEIFDSTNHMCCDNQVVVRSQFETSSCCHCIDQKLDIAIIADQSESVWDANAHHLLMLFIEDIVSNADVDSGNMRFALTMFNDDSFLEFHLNRYNRTADMIAHIRSIIQRTGGTLTGDAIAYMLANVFVEANGDRPGVENIAILITDGKSFNNTHTVEQASLARSLGVTMMAVGIGLPDLTELHQITLDPTNVFHVSDFNNLNTLTDQIENKFIGVCTEFPDAVYCGNSPYNPADYVCCGGHLVLITNGTDTECCGINKLYNSQSSVCCGMNVVPIIYANRRTCCQDSSLYDDSIEQCCGGNVISKSLECCGSDGYISGGCERCVNNQLITDYDETTHMCCQGVLRAKSVSHSCCCGTELFDSTLKTCCNNVVVDRLPSDTSTCCHCIDEQLDIVIVADDSESVRDANGHPLLMQFIEDIISNADVDSGNVRFALTVFNTDTYLEFHLNRYNNAADMITRVQQIPSRTGGTYTGNAIAYMLANVFTGLNGDRPGVENVAILITDGKSFNNTHTVEQASLARSLGITLIAVGIGTADITELHQITADPTNVFHVSDFNNLNTLTAQLESKFIGECTEFPDAVYCGAVPYNPLEYVCCVDNLVRIMDNTETECCGIDKLYNSQSSVCCGTNVVPIISANRRTCCQGWSLYDDSIEQCCGGNVISKSLECCGSVGYISGGCERCVNNILITDYDETTHICCQGVLRAKSVSHSCCCGTELFDSTLKTCCNNVVVDRLPSDTSTCCHCIDEQLDIVIVADDSESVRDANGHPLLMQFIEDIISNADVDSGNIRFALTVFNTDTYLEFHLNRYNNAADMITRVQQIPSRTGGTYTGDAIAYMLANVFTGLNGDRPGVENVAILITDGKSFNNTHTVEQASLARSLGITMIAVGIGTADITELHQITADPTNVFHVSDFNNLNTLTAQLESKFIGECTEFPDAVYCGAVPYNPLEYVCCVDNLVRITDNTETECCGIDKLYNSQNSVCCGTNVVPIISANRRTCCQGLSLYDDSIEQCCGGNVISKSLECCGSIGYFSGGCKRCVNNELITDYDETTHLCCGNVLHEKSVSHSCCCGTEIFDSTVQTCCNNRRINRLPFDTSTCCHCINRQLDIAIVADISESVYDANGYDLLMDFIEDIILDADVDSGNLRFALVMYNNIIYNEFYLNQYSTRAAMISHIEQITMQSGGTYTGDAINSMRTNVFAPQYGDRLDVENVAIIITDGKSFNNTKTIEQATLARLQGITLMAVGIGLQDLTELHQITEDPSNVFHVSDFSDLNRLTDQLERKFIGECEETPVLVYCGNVEYDPDLFVCCYGNIVAISDSSETTCCGSSKLYHPDRAVCCHSNVIPITNPLAKDCCGDVSLYNAATETCCSNGITTSGTSECCNGKAYNPSTEICCGGNVYDSHCNSCLNGNIFVPYDETKHICCNGNQHMLESEFTCCCGHESFDANSLVCCNGRVTSRMPYDDSKCCHCLNHKYDVAIVADMSESVYERNGVEPLKRFIAHLIQDSDVETGNVQIALSMFTHIVYNDFYLNTYSTTSDMLHHIGQISGRQGGTNTGLAIENVRDHVFTYANGDRYDAPNVAVIITDGKSYNSSYTVSQALLAKSEGILMLGVGIGLTDNTELYDIASEPSEDNVFTVDDFDGLVTLDHLMKRMFYPECHDAPTTVPNGPKCGGIDFDSDMYICCGGSIQFRHNGMNTQCCGSNSYDSNVFVCCDEELAPAIADSNTKCCGKLSYDPSRFICCDGKPRQRQGNGMTRCCGANTYDPKHSICCNDEVQPSYGKGSACCESVSFDSRCYTCNRKGQIRSKFNSDKSLCCAGNILNRRFGKNSCCCGRRQINLLTTACCNDKPRDVPPSSPCVCCGDKLYSVKSQVCCESRRKLKTHGNATQCCGEDIYNSKTHLCCDGSVTERRFKGDTQCCGQSPLNSKKEICCNGIVNVIPDDMSVNEATCCGSHVYNSVNHICCGDNVFMKNPGGLSACCGLSGAYNPVEDVCIDGDLVPIGSTCGNTIFDKNTQMCCSGNIQPRYGLYSSCCGDVSYDIRSQTCCSGILRDKQTDTEGGCCFGFPFYPRNHLCCNGYRVRKDKPSEDACCGLRKTYNSKEQICCNGNVALRPKGKITQCCGKRAFDPTENVCCDNSIKPRKFGDNTACCGTDVFNPLVSSCCEITVILKGDRATKSIDRKGRKKVSPAPIDDKEIIEDDVDDDDDVSAIKNLKDKIKELRQKLEEENSDDNKERLEKLEKLISKIDSLDDSVRKLKRRIRELEQEADSGSVEKLNKLRNKLKSLREKLEVIKQNVEDAKSSDDGVKKERTKLRRILKKFRKIRKQFSRTEADQTVKEADEEINEANLSDTNDQNQLQKRVKKWKRLYNKLKKRKNNKRKNGKAKDDEPEKVTKEDKIRKVKKSIKQIDRKLAGNSINAATINKLKKRKQAYLSLLNKLTKKDDQDNTVNDKIRLQKQKLEDIKKSITAIKDAKTLRSVKKDKKKFEEDLQKLKIKRKDEEETDLKDIPVVDNEDENKSINERLANLKRKLEEYKSLLQKVSKKSKINEIKRRKRIVENRIEQLLKLKIESKRNKNVGNTKKTNKKTPSKDTLNGDDETKTIKERLRYLRQKLEDIERDLSKASDKSRKQELRQLKTKVETRIEELKNLRQSSTDDSEKKETEDAGQDKKKITKQSSEDPMKDDDDTNSIKERLRYLRQKLENIESDLSKATDKSRKQELRQLKKKVETRIEELKNLRQSSTDDSEKKETEDAGQNKKKTTKQSSEDPMKDDDDTKSIKERLRYLRQKLENIESDLSKATDKSRKQELRQLKKKVETRIEELKNLRQSSTNDSEKEETEDSGPNKKKIIKQSSEDPMKDDDDTKSIKERLRYLRQKLENIESDLSKATDKSRKQELRQLMKKVETRIEELQETRQSSTNGTEKKEKELTIQERIDLLKSYVDVLQTKIAGTKNKITKQSFRAKMKSLEDRIMILSDEIGEDGATDETLTERLDKLKTKLAAVKKRLSNNPKKKSESTLKKKRGVLKTRIEKLEEELSHSMNQ